MALETVSAPANFGAEPLPPLENGDRLTRAEFLRRYRAMPHVAKAELIEGVVFMPSPVSTDFHGAPHADLAYWLGCYRYCTHGLVAADNATVLLDEDNAPQPDLLLMLRASHGGKTRSIDGLTAGPPELAIEICSTTANRDLHDKFRAYLRNGVPEYLVWRTRDRAIDWFVLKDGEYLPQTPAGGVLESRCFPGLRLDVAGLLAGSLFALRSAVEAGCATPEHAAFVVKLADAAKSSASA